MICEELLAANGIDYNEAIERFGGNEELHKRIAVKFGDDPHFAALSAALDRDDLEEAHHHAHALKGVAGNLSLGNLYRAACRVNEALSRGDLDEARSLMPTVGEAHAAALVGVRQLKQM